MDARRAYYLFDGGTALLHALAFTLMLVCQVQGVGLTPFQLVIMGTAMEGRLLLCEIPTGAVADLCSRRRSVLIGTAIIAVSFLLQGGVAVVVAHAGRAGDLGVGLHVRLGGGAGLDHRRDRRGPRATGVQPRHPGGVGVHGGRHGAGRPDRADGPTATRSVDWAESTVDRVS